MYQGIALAIECLRYVCDKRMIFEIVKIRFSRSKLRSICLVLLLILICSEEVTTIN